MRKPTPKEPDEKDLLELFELAKLAEKQAREMCEGITAHAKKWRLRAEAKGDKAERQK